MNNTVRLDQQSILDVTENVLNAIKSQGLVLLPENVAQFSYQFYTKRKQLMAGKTVSPDEIVKYDLLNGVKSRNTVKNWINKGIIREKEFVIIDGKYRILVSAIKRLNKFGAITK